MYITVVDCCLIVVCVPSVKQPLSPPVSSPAASLPVDLLTRVNLHSRDSDQSAGAGVWRATVRRSVAACQVLANRKYPATCAARDVMIFVITYS